MKKINDVHLKAICDLRQRRDHAAYCIGVAAVEYERAKQGFLDAIAVSEQDEKAIAETALNEAGYDSNVGDYRINRDGVIGELIDGRWCHPDTKEPIQVDETGVRLI